MENKPPPISILLQELQRQAAEITRLRAAAEKGHLNALFQYAVMLYKGDGILKDEDTALDLFRSAAESDHPEAKKLMGI